MLPFVRLKPCWSQTRPLGVVDGMYQSTCGV